MKARLLIKRRIAVSRREFAEIVVWQAPVKGSPHGFKYRLAFVADGQCVLRYDNEAGKGDHRHVGTVERPYRFVDVDTLLADFERDIERWRK